MSLGSFTVYIILSFFIIIYNLFHFYQAAVSAMCNPPRPGDQSYETFIKVKYNPAYRAVVALYVTFF